MKHQVIKDPILYIEILESKNKNKDAKVLDTHVNLEYLLEHFHAKIRFNLMTRQREIILPDLEISREDVENNALGIITYLATLNFFPIRQIDSHLNMIALNHTYHPIVECIKKKPWDGFKRLDAFIDTIQAEDQALARKIIKTWMVAAIAAAHSVDGFTNQGVLVLQGEQGIGKTRWIKALDPLGCNAVKEGAFLDPSNKDSIWQLAQYWIAELGEVECVFKKSEMGRLKSFITMDSDYVRLPYARKPTRLPRRSVYAATVNDLNYLTDDTGNRRWWTVACKSINIDHELDMQQVWAEVYALWKEGALTYLESDVQHDMNSANKSHEKIDPLREKLLAKYDWEHPVKKWMTATAILEELGFANPTIQEVRRMAAILKDINGVGSRPSHGMQVHAVPARFLIPGICTI